MEREVPIRRILVALDASPSSLAALDAAAELASLLGTELSGLFVEDVNLLHASELPSARALGSLSGRSVPLERSRLERGLRAEAERARGALVAAAERNLLRWSFRVTRGMVVPEILAAVSESNLVVVGRAGWSGSRLGSTARAVAVGAPALALVVGREARPSSGVVALYNGSPASEQALALAAGLAGEGHVKIVVLEEGSRDARSLAARWLAGRGIAASIVEFPFESAHALARMANREGAGLLVVPRDGSIGGEAALAVLMEEVQCPMLLVG